MAEERPDEPPQSDQAQQQPADAACNSSKENAVPVSGPVDGPLEAGAEPSLEELRQPAGSLDEAVARIEKNIEALASLPLRVQEIHAILEDRDNLDRARESAIDKMHVELSVYRQKGVDHAKKSILLSLIGLYDHFEQCLARIQEPAREELEWLREMLLETLNRESVELIDDAPTTLNRELHRVLRIVNTNDPMLGGTVHQVLKRGFRWHDSLLRPEHVVLYRHTEAQGEDPKSTDCSAEPSETSTS